MYIYTPLFCPFPQHKYARTLILSLWNTFSLSYKGVAGAKPHIQNNGAEFVVAARVSLRLRCTFK